MADTKITSLTELAEQPASTDMIPLVDTSDTTQATSGTTKKITRANLIGTVAEGEGGTGETTYTDGQLLVGNTAGGLTKATLTGGTNVTVTNGDGSISIAAADTNVSTNLSAAADGTSLTVSSSDGTNASIPAVTTSAWGAMTDEDKTKLDGVATAATANDTDTNLKARANHTGTQAASTISDFDTEVANNTAVAANTAKTGITSGQASEITANTVKVTNATHTGEVTGATALTVADDVIDEANLKADNSPTDDYVLTAKSSAAGGLTWAAASGGGGGGGSGDITSVVAGTGLSGGATSGAATLNVDVGIADDKIAQIDSASVADDDFARFTANGLEGRSASEVLSDIGAAASGHAHGLNNLSDVDTTGAASGKIIKHNGSSWAVADDTDTNTNQLTTFTVSATTDTTATTISQGDDLMFAAGTGITCETTADGTVTIASTVTDTNTQLSTEEVQDIVGAMFSGNTETRIAATYEDGDGTIDLVVDDMTANTMGSGFTVSATTDTNATTITQGDDLMFTAGTGITCETTADGTVTIASTVTDTNTTYTAGDGLDLSGTTFSADLKSAGGLKITSTELELDVHGLGDVTGSGDVSGWSAGDHMAIADASDSNNPKKIKLPAEIGIACSDEVTALTTGNTAADTQKASILIPRAMTVTEVKISLYKKASSTVTVDVNYHASAPESAATMLNAALSMTGTNLSAATSTFASSATSYALAEDSFVTVDVDAAGTTAFGLKVWLLGYWT